MSISKTFTYRICRMLMALLLAVVLPGSCSDETESEAACDNVRFHFTLNLQSLSPAGASRAVIPPSNPQTGALAENYLNLDDVRFIMFDADQKVLCELEAKITPEEESGYTRYVVDFSISDEYFTKPGNRLNVEFYIMAIANYTQYDPWQVSFPKGGAMKNIFDSQQLSFVLPDGSPWWYPHFGTSTDGTIPSAPQYIPMSGLQHFSVAASDILAKLYIDLGEINMLRAMAKIEVVDRIGAVDAADGTVRQPDKDERASIDKIELMGFYTRGTLLPLFNQWNISSYPETQYVTSPFVPDNFQYANPPLFSNMQEGTAFVRNFGLDEAATVARKDGCKVYSVYIPEYKVPGASQELLSGTMAKPANPAWVRVTVRQKINNPDVDKYQETLPYELKLTGYSNGVSDGKNIPLLRNNIYRYEINSVSSKLTNIVWTVCPMSTVKIDLPSFE